MTDEILSCSDVWFRYPDGTIALRGISLAVYEGEILAILGPNGAGKSTLLLVLAGLLKPWRGFVRYRGERLRVDDPSIRRSIGMVFQNPDDQLFCPTVFDDLAFSLRQLELPEDEVKRRVEEAALLVGVSHLLHKPPYRLSFGEKKRVALASILIYDPEILILDEPTSSMSPRFISQIKEILEERRSIGRTHILATQDVEFAYELADRIVIIIEGRLRREGSPEIIIQEPNLLEEADLKIPKGI